MATEIVKMANSGAKKASTAKKAANKAGKIDIPLDPEDQLLCLWCKEASDNARSTERVAAKIRKNEIRRQTAERLLMLVVAMMLILGLGLASGLLLTFELAAPVVVNVMRGILAAVEVVLLVLVVSTWEKEGWR